MHAHVEGVTRTNDSGSLDEGRSSIDVEGGTRGGRTEGATKRGVCCAGGSRRQEDEQGAVTQYAGGCHTTTVTGRWSHDRDDVHGTGDEHAARTTATESDTTWYYRAHNMQTSTSPHRVITL